MVNLVRVMAPNDPRQQIADALSAGQLPQLPQLQGSSPMSGGQGGGPSLNNDIFNIAKSYFSRGAPRTVDMGSNPLPADAFSGAVPNAGTDLSEVSVGPSTWAAAAPAAADAAPAASGAGAGLGAGAGAAGSLAAAAIPTYLGLSTAPYRLSADWWKNFGNELTTGQGPNATYNSETSPAQQEYNTKQSLYQMLQRQGGDTAIIGGASGNNIPSGVLDLAKQYGMLNSDGTVNKNWSGGEDPSAITAAIQARQGVKGGSGGGRIL